MECIETNNSVLRFSALFGLITKPLSKFEAQWELNNFLFRKVFSLGNSILIVLLPTQIIVFYFKYVLFLSHPSFVGIRNGNYIFDDNSTVNSRVINHARNFTF